MPVIPAKKRTKSGRPCNCRIGMSGSFCKMYKDHHSDHKLRSLDLCRRFMQRILPPHAACKQLRLSNQQLLDARSLGIRDPHSSHECFCFVRIVMQRNVICCASSHLHYHGSQIHSSGANANKRRHRDVLGLQVQRAAGSSGPTVLCHAWFPAVSSRFSGALRFRSRSEFPWLFGGH
jgi:hypothetical protein